MNIKINDNIYITNDDTCFILMINQEPLYYKTLDRVFLRIMNELLLQSDVDSVISLKNKLDELYSMIYGVFGVSGMYPDLKVKQSKYTGVRYGKENK